MWRGSSNKDVDERMEEAGGVGGGETVIKDKGE